jgi:ribonuclease E
MSDEQERAEQKQHWLELAELLGLPPDTTPTASAPPGQDASTAKPSSAPREAIRAESKDMPLDANGPNAEPGVSFDSPAESDIGEDPERVEAVETEFDAWEPAPLDSEAEPDMDDDPRPSSRRRRGRRGRGLRRDGPREPDETRGDDDKTGPPGGEASADEEIAAEERFKRGRRGRGRKHHKKAPEAADQGEVTAFEEEMPEPESSELSEELDEVQDEATEPERDEADDQEDVDTLSDWNVPSWTELIESLYRPER